MRTLTLERSRLIDAPVAQVWDVISDLGGYHRHAGSGNSDIDAILDSYRHAAAALPAEG